MLRPKLFINRPILAIALSVMIVMVGVIGLTQLPVEKYPDIAPPTISVSATYTGASAATLQKSVIVPLEESINGVEDMLYMTSTASNTGSASITVYFKQGTNPDMAAVNVQNRVTKVQGSLPAEVTQIGVTTQKRQSSQLKIMALYSPRGTYDQNFLINYMKINIVPQIQRISGVGEVMVMGGDYAMRIWLKPDVMAQYGLVPSDVSAALAEQNIEAPTGTLGEDSESTFQYALKYRGRYEKGEEYENIVIKALPNGRVLRLRDVAEVELGSSSYSFNSSVAGAEAANCIISQTSGSNANEIIIQINALTEEIKRELPHDMVYTDMMDTKVFLDASIRNVIETLILAIILVIVVVYLFLQSFRSTLIPAATIIVSLIGSFACIYVAGFSLNLLTLFALVLVIGTVVDDAIVVVEAVQAKFDEGYTSAYKATNDAMGGITSAIITTTLVFMSVFIPVCFMGGTSGTFYTEFGVTMACAVVISTLNALTLSPALCALLMTPHQASKEGERMSFSSRFHIAFETSFSRVLGKYGKAMNFFFRKRWLVYSGLIVAVVALLLLIKTTKTGLVPDEDTGTLFVTVTASPGTTLSQTNTIMDEVEKRLSTLSQIEIFSKITGYNLMGSGETASGGTFIIMLKDWSERKEKQDSKDAVIGQIFALTSDVKSASIFAFSPPMIMGYGTSSGLELHIQDRKGGDIELLNSYTQAFIAGLNGRKEIQNALTTFSTQFPQYLVEVDAAKCKMANLSPSDVLNVLSYYVGGNYASNINRFSKLYRVMIQARPEARLDRESLTQMFVRTGDGEMAPIDQFITLTKEYGAENLSRFNLFNSISVSVMPAEGYSSGDAIQAVAEVAKATLPAGYGYEYGGMTREEASAGTSTLLIFVICLLFVYLILCSLYESLFIPLAVMLSIPFGLVGSFLFAKMFGIENNIYMQIGLIMLIGLLAKTAILITEYASSRRRGGMDIIQAAMEAAKVRLRPVLMTALTMIIGLFPLIISAGAGANCNRSLAVGTIGGMLIGTVALLFVVPVLFIAFQRIEEHVMPKRNLNEDENDEK